MRGFKKKVKYYKIKRQINQFKLRSTMSGRLDPDALFARGFKAGSIVRLKMKNFLTYDECEFFTGPRLNIVIGPNGTGKSALTHAICLACCGSTGDVGKNMIICFFLKYSNCFYAYSVCTPRPFKRFK